MSQTVKVVRKCIKHINEIWGYILSTVYWTCTRRKMGEHFDSWILIQKYKEAA